MHMHHHLCRQVKASGKALRRLRVACEAAKRVLSSSSSAAVEVEGLVNDVDVSLTLSRETFDALNAPLFERCIDTVKVKNKKPATLSTALGQGALACSSSLHALGGLVDGSLCGFSLRFCGHGRALSPREGIPSVQASGALWLLDDSSPPPPLSSVACLCFPAMRSPPRLSRACCATRGSASTR